jgi:hypothetical protein
MDELLSHLRFIEPSGNELATASCHIVGVT